MVSIESKLFCFLLRLIKKKKFLDMQFAVGKFNFNTSQEPTRKTSKICHVEKRRINGHNTFTLTPKSEKSNTYILYLHGGAYVQSFLKQPWKFLSFLVKHTRCTVIAPDYPLAPEYTYLQAFEFVVPLYMEIIAKPEASQTIVMGDSAGRGFALALAQELKRDSLPQPDKIILLSPWLDITLKNPAIRRIDPVDPFLGIAGLKKAGLLYAGTSDPNTNMVSPINGSLEGLGKISIFIGTHDIFVADTRKLKSRANQQGILINYREYKNMIHVWMLLDFPESQQAKNEIIEIILNNKIIL